MQLPAAPVHREGSAVARRTALHSLVCTHHPRDSNVLTKSCCAKGCGTCEPPPNPGHQSASAEPEPPTRAAASAGPQARNTRRTQHVLVLDACSPSSLCPSIPNLCCSTTTFSESIKYISNHSQEIYFKISTSQSSPD